MLEKIARDESKHIEQWKLEPFGCKLFEDFILSDSPEHTQIVLKAVLESPLWPEAVQLRAVDTDFGELALTSALLEG